uniref:Transmembrane protein 144 n=1 Tax=Haemonchus contortus TaxID=6289 RepID=A0A7I5E5S8_HAECO
MFVPIRRYDAGDGMFAQWVMSTAILMIGFIVFCLQGFPGFYPLAMLGGAFWSIGNSTAIPIISRLGMTVGILIWNTTNCLTGWAGGRFGLFGMKANPPASQILNYGGLVCVIIGGILFSRVQSETNASEMEDGIPTTIKETIKNSSSRTDTIRNSSNQHETVNLTSEESPTEKTFECDNKDETSSRHGKQRIIGIAMSLAAGVFYGMTFVPVIYMIDNPDKFPGYPDDGLSYVFSHYFGIFLTSTIMFVGYAMMKRNHPLVPSFIVLPSLLAGILWAIAQSSFFVANQHLSQAVTFPIITMLPGCIASAWSILYFREIKGKRNLRILAVAMLVTLAGATMVGFSKFIQLW